MAFLWLLCGLAGEATCSADQTAEADAVRDRVIAGMRDAREKLLRLPDGWRLRFAYQVVDDPLRRLAFPRAEGEIRVRWPAVYVRFAGDMSTSQGESARTIRQGSHDFDSGLGVALEDKSTAETTPFRHLWSAGTMMPLVFQYFEVTDQRYAPGKPFPSHVHLPQVFDQFREEYRVVGSEGVAGERCTILDREGHDRLWIAEEKGFVVVQRRLRDAHSGVVQQQLQATALQELAPGLWLPGEQTLTLYDPRTGELQSVERTTIVAWTQGGLRPEELKVTVPPDVASFVDQVEGSMYARPLAKDPFLAALGDGRALVAEYEGRRGSLRLLVVMAFGLAVVIAILARGAAALKGA